MREIRVVVEAPPPVVFDYLADPRHRPEWQSSLRSVRVDDDGPPAVGTRWTDHTTVGARPRMRIVELDPPTGHRAGTWREVGRWHGLTADLTLRFEALGDDADPTPDLTLVIGAFRLGGSRWWLPARLVLGLVSPPAVAADLRRAARILGARH